MSKKDYVILARAIKLGKAGIGYNSINVDIVINTLASELAKDNARFDLVKFLKATK